MRSDASNISKEEAKRRLRCTGMTLAEIDAAVAALPTKQYGKRFKVSSQMVADIIARHAIPATQTVRTIKPLSAAHRARFRAKAETERTLGRLMADRF